MQLYAGKSRDFIDDSIQNQISAKLSDAFERCFRYAPPKSEVASWQNSLRAFSQVIDYAELNDHGVLLEYQLPQTSRRLDCMVCGKDQNGRDQAVVVELKQWEKCEAAAGENLVTTFVGGGMREKLHPSSQVSQYQRYLQDTHTAFYSGDSPVGLSSCSYLHNYRYGKRDELLNEKFSEIIKQAPLFTADDVSSLSDYLKQKMKSGEGFDILKRIQQSEFRPSKKLMQHVANVIKGIPQFVLLDEQLVVYDSVKAVARQGFNDQKKSVIVIHGGPGTGKSVIAINLLSDLSRENIHTQYATGSKAFTSTLRKIVGSRASAQFKYFNSYLDADINDVDVLICDEAHRIRETSNNRFTPKGKRSSRLQIQEIIDAAKVSVFVIDENQCVRPNEIGSPELIKQTAEENGCEISEYRLNAQFRCADSDGFVNWVNNTLGIKETANILYTPDEDNFDFQIFKTPLEL